MAGPRLYDVPPREQGEIDPRHRRKSAAETVRRVGGQALEEAGALTRALERTEPTKPQVPKDRVVELKSDRVTEGLDRLKDNLR